MPIHPFSIGGDIIEKELALVETQSLLEQARADLEGTRHEAAMAGTYKKEVDELSVYLQEYQTKTTSKVCSYYLHQTSPFHVDLQISMLQSNLAKAEAEVAHLDAELMKMMHKII